MRRAAHTCKSIFEITLFSAHFIKHVAGPDEFSS
jgi:hypothetical protein